MAAGDARVGTFVCGDGTVVERWEPHREQFAVCGEPICGDGTLCGEWYFGLVRAQLLLLPKALREILPPVLVPTVPGVGILTPVVAGAATLVPTVAEAGSLTPTASEAATLTPTTPQTGTLVPTEVEVR